MSTTVCLQPRGTLDPHRQGSAACHFEAALRKRIVGQDAAVQALVDVYQVFCAGLNAPGRPVGNFLLLGPTGVAKTGIVEAAAEILFEDSRDVTKVDCAEFQHSHEIAKLIGSPPGYIGHRETDPVITQEALAKTHRGELKLSFLLFDEIEKASDALWQLLLGILDKATLTLGDVWHSRKRRNSKFPIRTSPPSGRVLFSESTRRFDGCFLLRHNQPHRTPHLHCCRSKWAGKNQNCDEVFWGVEC